MAMKLIAGLLIKLNRSFVFLVDGQTNRFTSFEQHCRQVEQTSKSVTLPSLFGMNVHAFQISDLWSLGDHVSLENQSVVLCPNPDAALLDAPSSARAKAAGIILQRVGARLLQSHGSVNCHDLVEIVDGSRPQVASAFGRRGRFQLKQKFATDQTRFLSAVGVILPKVVNGFLLATDQVSVQAIASQPRKRSQRVFRACFNHRRMAEEGHPLQPAVTIPTGVERSAVVSTHQSVIADQAGHEDRVNRPRRKELEYFGFVGCTQFTDNVRLVTGEYVRRSCFGFMPHECYGHRLLLQQGSDFSSTD